MKTVRTAVAGLAMAAVLTGSAWSETLTIGVSLETPSIDPYFYAFKNSYQVANQIFDPLVSQDAKQKFIPGLAESWKNIDDKTWQFNLRKGAKWHDGSPFTADDVMYSVERAKGGIPGSPTTPSRMFLSGGKTYKKIDDYTIQVITPAPYATLVTDLVQPMILSRKNGTGAATKDYDSGKVTIGTGPYKFVEFVRGDRVVLDANPNYWGGKPEWDRVVMRAIPTAPTRLAALLSGEVDVINDVPAEDIEKLKKNPKVKLHIEASNGIVRFLFGHGRMTFPHVRDNDGKVLFPNPLKDWRVRKAFSLAIDRQRIVDRVMAGNAIAAGQGQPPGGHGHDPNLKPDPYDPEQAKKLLAEAGYGKGFQLTVHSPADRYPNDKKIAEAVVQMLNRIGIKADLTLVPNAVFSSRASKGEFAYYLGYWQTPTGDAGSVPIYGLHSYQPGKKLGAANWGRYNNRDFDELVEQSNGEMDAAKREALLSRAWGMVTKDVGNVWVLWVANSWATRPGLTVDKRIDSHTMGTSIHKAK